LLKSFSMETTFTIYPAQTTDLAAIITLLQQNKLPVEDIADGQQQFWVIKDGDNIAGAIGIEVYGNYGLLRSMATDKAYRNKGIAAILVDSLFEFAKKQKLTAIYLLTETAQHYFEKKGFVTVNRDGVPAEIKQSKEFTHLCPSTAIVMKKEILQYSPSGDGGKIKLLFVCIENSNRSQMSQAFAKIIGGDKVEAYSAGSKPSGIVNPKAIAAMKELGYDLSKHDSKTLDEVKQYAPFDAVVTMGCGDACPWMPAKQFIDWQIPDPKHMEPEAFNKVRDYIKEKVGELLGRV
jgi:arsenate reductase (thioredoxin)